jgi:hypothetical protein
MKRGPRQAETRFADYLSLHFGALGLSPVERVPVIGRTGPDITFNELWLAIDAKRREEVPISAWKLTDTCTIVEYADGICVSQLKNFSRLLTSEDPPQKINEKSTKTISGYLEHMAGWKFHHKDMPELLRGAIPAVVCRKTGGRTANALFVIYKEDLRLLRILYKEIRNGTKKT